MTVDCTKYWHLTPFIATETDKTHRTELEVMRVWQPAFLEPDNPDHCIAVQVHRYGKSLTDLLNTAAAQLTALYANYPRWVRLALVRRLEERFIGWAPVDPTRLAALNRMDAKAQRDQTYAADRQERAEQIQKEKQRKKAQERRKQLLRRTAAGIVPSDRSKQLSGSGIKSAAAAESFGSSEGFSSQDTEDQETVQEDAAAASSKEDQAPTTTVRYPSPNILTPIAHEKLLLIKNTETFPTGNGSCDQLVCPSLPRSSVASIWTSKDESISTPNTSPYSSEKEQSRTSERCVDFNAPMKDIRALMKRLLDCPPQIPTNPEFATTAKEEEMDAHILRIARTRGGPETASLMATLLHKPQPDSGLSKDESAKISTQLFAAPTPVRTSKSIKQKRKARAEKEKTDSRPARDIDLAGDLLYSASKKVIPPVSVEDQPNPAVSQETVISDDEIICELDTMSSTPLRGRQFNKAR